MIPLHDGQMHELVGVLRRRICHVLSTPSLPRVVEVACVAFQWTITGVVRLFFNIYNTI